ncbi:MAG: CHAT domain-containing protein [Gemmatimonadaceae bacterium]
MSRLLLIPDGPLHAVPSIRLLSRVRLTAQVETRYTRRRATLWTGTRWCICHRDNSSYVGLRRSGATRWGAPGRRIRRARGEGRVGWYRVGVPGRARIIAGAAATGTAVQGAANGFDVVHVATHAIADDRDPLASHLVLAGDATNDGLLHLPESAVLRMAARLLVLSGCETLVGRLYEGEGFMGMARAATAGEAESVVATRWPTGAASADLMAVFYGRLAMGHESATALREAKLEFRRRPGFAHPFY